MKTCTKCHLVKPAEDFPVDRSTKDGRYGKCKECDREEARAYYHANKNGRQEYELVKKYGITLQVYWEMYDQQDGRCGICQKGYPKHNGGNLPLCVDHCHRSGVVRGLLCNVCNRHLGILEKDNFIAKAVDYLSSTGTTEVVSIGKNSST